MSAKATIRGVTYEIPAKLTLGELHDIERAAGADAGPIGALIGSLWIAMRRVNPAAKFEDLRDVEFDESLVQEDDAGPPTIGAPGSGSAHEENIGDPNSERA